MFTPPTAGGTVIATRAGVRPRRRLQRQVPEAQLAVLPDAPEPERLRAIVGDEEVVVVGAARPARRARDVLLHANRPRRFNPI